MKNTKDSVSKNFGRQIFDEKDFQLKCYMVTGNSADISSIFASLQEETGGVAIVCFDGDLYIEIDSSPIHMDKGTLCTFFSGNRFEYKGSSLEFIGYIAVIGSYFISNLDTHISITYFLYNKNNPVIPIPSEELNTIQQSLQIFSDKMERTDHPYHKEIMREILLIAMYEICAVYEQQEHNISGKKERLKKEEQLKEFLRLVELNCREERALEFYAQKLSLTSKYLSSNIKSLTGYSAAEWIHHILLLRIKSVLRSSPMSMQQVADYFHFPNASFFGKFFKKYTGMTPREYKLNA